MSTSPAWVRQLEALERQSQQEARHEVLCEAEGAHFQFVSRWYAFLTWFLWVPFLRKKYFTAHAAIRARLGEIVTKYAPFMAEGLREWQAGFNRWESENRLEGCGSEDAIELENEGKRKVNAGYRLMMAEVHQLRYWHLHFCGFLNPTELVRNPYRGYLSTETARKYVEDLQRAFPSSTPP